MGCSKKPPNGAVGQVNGAYIRLYGTSFTISFRRETRTLRLFGFRSQRCFSHRFRVNLS
jgi:hypothetical protein